MNLRYSKHLRITNYIEFEPFILVINVDVVSSSSHIFSTLVYVFKCNVLLFWINEIYHLKKNKNKLED